MNSYNEYNRKNRLYKRGRTVHSLKNLIYSIYEKSVGENSAKQFARQLLTTTFI